MTNKMIVLRNNSYKAQHASYTFLLNGRKVKAPQPGKIYRIVQKFKVSNHLLYVIYILLVRYIYTQSVCKLPIFFILLVHR